MLQVSYRPPTHPSQRHHPPEFVVLVDTDAYTKWKVNNAGVALVDVFASSKDPIMACQHGQTGMKTCPSKQELAEFFNTEDSFAAAEFILQNGKVANVNADMK